MMSCLLRLSSTEQDDVDAGVIYVAQLHGRRLRIGEILRTATTTTAVDVAATAAFANEHFYIFKIDIQLIALRLFSDKAKR